MLFGVAMLVALDDWLAGHSKNHIFLAGIFAGLALGTKYTSGILLIVGVVVILSQIRPLRWQRTIIAILLFGTSAVLVMLPWLVTV